MRIWTGAVLSLASFAAYAGVAGPPTTIPEPGTLGLLVAAAVFGLAFGRGRKK